MIVVYIIVSVVILSLSIVIISHLCLRRLQKKAFKLSSFLVYEVLVREFQSQNKTPENIQAFEDKKQVLDMFTWASLPTIPVECLKYFLVFPYDLKKSVPNGEYDAVLAYSQFMLDFIEKRK